jgi:CRP-like cAMP-binding protein
VSSLETTLQGMVAKFARRAPLDEGDRKALLSLPFRTRTCEAGLYLVREGSPTTECVLILEGYAFRHKLTVEGDRQIVSLHIDGDFVDLEGSLLNVADHNVQTLTRCRVAVVPSKAIVALIEEHPAIGRAMWVDTLVDGSIHREWVMNVGRRPAKERIAHLFCEIGRRLEVAGLSKGDGYSFPMTQEQLADATGLTAVHVNRTIKLLESEGYIRRERRFLHVPDWEALRALAGFNEIYLHLDQVA